MSVKDKLSDGNGGTAVPVEYFAGAVVIGAVLALVLIKRGFRGVNLAGVSVGIK